MTNFCTFTPLLALYESNVINQIITNFLEWHSKDKEKNIILGEYLTTKPKLFMINELIHSIGGTKKGPATRIYTKLRKEVFIEYDSWTQSERTQSETISSDHNPKSDTPKSDTTESTSEHKKVEPKKLKLWTWGLTTMNTEALTAGWIRREYGMKVFEDLTFPPDEIIAMIALFFMKRVCI